MAFRIEYHSDPVKTQYQKKEHTFEREKELVEQVVDDDSVSAAQIRNGK